MRVRKELRVEEFDAEDYLRKLRERKRTKEKTRSFSDHTNRWWTIFGLVMLLGPWVVLFAFLIWLFLF